MSDDIDIEEHDVLDNPRIRKIFAGMVDISAIKEEAPDFEDEPMEHEYASEEFLPSECQDADDFDDPEVEYPVHNNKIILGSKPSKENEGSLHTEGYHDKETALVFGRKSLSLNTLLIEEVRSESEATSAQDDGQENIEEFQEFEEDEYSVEREDYSYNSVVILGSKPNTNKLKLNAVVSLEDWGPRLENSPCYCKDCEILFATRNVLDAHKMTAHSFLVALDESNISRNTARKSTGLNTYSRGTLCHHCNKRFIDDTLLIKHLYENLTSGTAKCDECSAVFNNPADLKAHARTHVKTVSLNASTAENTFYQCFICGIFTHMKYAGLYKRHMLKNHCIKEPSMALVAYDPHCRFCNSIITATSNLKLHIKMRHTKKFLQKPNQSEKVESKTHKYQCLKCNEVFLIYQLARSHRNEKHPESKGTKLFNKITYRKNAVSVNFKKITAVSKQVTGQPQGSTTKNSLPLVPRKVLFKCDQCQIHFTNYAAAIVHSKYCLKYKGSWKCQKCRRSFKMADRKHHLRQHEFTDTFDVYTTSLSLCKRMLSKCPQCKLYLHEQDFWLHYQSQCKTKEGYSCLQCKAIIQQSSVEFHKQLHNFEGYSDDDMIWIEYVKVPVETPAVDELSSVKVLEPNTGAVESIETIKKTKPAGYKLIMSYCQNCKCCMIGKKNIQKHLTGKCVSKFVKRSICKTCGLKFSCHKKCPMRVKGIKLDDMKFVSLQDKKVINPPIPKYNKCKKCGINGYRRTKIDLHVCKGVKKTCKYCKEEFSDAAYKPHIALHEYRKPKKNSKNAVIEMPELLKKYEMLTQSWNLLYSCAACKIVTDSYDKSVDHAQSHYSSRTEVQLKKCLICKLKFDSNCFVRHRELHSGNADIHKESFKVLSYDYKLLLTDKWLGMFKSLPEMQIQLIVNNSIYRYTRKIKMEVAKNGAPNLTLYKCCKCRKYLVPCNVLKHYTHAACCNTDTGYQCPTCSVTFEDEKNYKIHAAIHKCVPRQNVRTVVFNQKDDKRINEAIRAADGKTVKYKHHYYKCNSCDYCVLNKNAVNHHSCTVIKKMYCGKCKIYMSKYSARDHKNTHKNDPKFSRKDIKFYGFTPSDSKSKDSTTENDSCDDSDPHKEKPEKGKPGQQKTKPVKMNKSAERSILKRLLETDDVPMKKKKVNLVKEQMQCSSKDGTHALLIKCACGLHFTSSIAAEAHARRCSPGSKESSDDCSKCGRLFDTSELFKHLCKHHSNNKSVTFSVIPVSSPDKEDDDSDSVKDETGSYRESEDTAQPRENKKIINMKRLLTKNAAKYKPIAYKCRCCSTHFMSEIARRMHMKKTAVRPFSSSVKACEDCGLVFIKTSLDIHKYIHHTTMNLSRKDIIVNGDGKAVVNKKANKSKQIPQESDQVELYLCKGCKLHFMSKSGLHVHIKENSAPKPAACDECDLLFCKNALPFHKKHHHEKLQLTRDDIPINSSFKSKCIPKLSVTTAVYALDSQSKNVYRCDDCLVHFSSYGRLITHLNKLAHEEVTKECSLCKQLFCSADLKRHKLINHEGTRTLEEFDVVGSKTLYKCAMCPAHFVREQRLDNHLRKNEHDSPTVRCSLCGLTFTNIALSFHRSIHHEAKTVIIDFRIIVKGNNKGNVTEKSEERKKQFAPKKKYRKKCKLFKCSKCKTHFMKSETLRLHNHTKKVLQQRRNCPYCGLLFSPRTVARHMLAHHIKMKYNFEDFHIIMDTAIKKRKSRKDDEDTVDDSPENTADELDNAIDDAGSLERTDISSDSPTTSIGNSAEDNIVSKKFISSNIRCADGTVNSIKILYKCTKCQLHFVSKNTLVWHLCCTDHSAAKNMVHCSNCGLGFTKKSLYNHENLHHIKHKLSLEDFKFATYLENPDSDVKKVSTVDSADVDEDNTMESTESEIVQDLNMETELGEPDTSIPVGNYNNRLYKCDTCSIHFMDEESLRIHKQDDTHAELKYDCTICDLAFDVTNIPNHIDIHHRKLGLKAQGFNIVSELSENMEVDTAEGTDDSIVSQSTTAASVASTPDRTVQDTKLKLYKCADCDVHFLAQTTCYKHIVKHKRMDPEDYIMCKICGLQFKIVSLNKHMNRHHRSGSFKIEDVLIEEYHPDVLTNGAPKLNIYQASNKVQSRLVSTTTDKDVEVSEASQSEPNSNIVDR